MIRITYQWVPAFLQRGTREAGLSLPLTESTATAATPSWATRQQRVNVGRRRSARGGRRSEGTGIAKYAPMYQDQRGDRVDASRTHTPGYITPYYAVSCSKSYVGGGCSNSLSAFWSIYEIEQSLTSRGWVFHLVHGWTCPQCLEKRLAKKNEGEQSGGNG